MHRPIRSSLLAALLAGAALPAFAQSSQPAPAASGDWQVDAPGVVHKITPADLPAPFATPSAHASPGVVARPAMRR